MSSISKVSKGWRARWRTPEGAQRSKTFAKKSDAERHLVNIDHTKLSGAYVDPSAGRVTFQVYAEEWRAAQVHRPTTAAQVETNLRLHVYPTFGSRSLASLRPGEIQAWVTGITLAPATVEVIYRYVSSL